MAGRCQPQEGLGDRTYSQAKKLALHRSVHVEVRGQICKAVLFSYHVDPEIKLRPADLAASPLSC